MSAFIRIVSASKYWKVKALLVFCFLTCDAMAFADPSAEAAAKVALERAAADYTANAFERAIARIDGAMAACKKGCSKEIQAALFRDKGVMLARKATTNKRGSDADAAAAAFVESLVLVPTLTLPKAYDLPDVRAAFNKGREAIGLAPLAASAPEVAATSTGDFKHSPWSEQRVGTPLPIFVEYDGPLAHVIARYQKPDDDEWKRVELHRFGKGWGGALPCAAMKEGTLRYFVQGLDEDQLPVASSGDKKHPFAVEVRTEIESIAPHLPGRKAPRPCAEGGCDKDPSACGIGEETISSSEEGAPAESPTEPNPDAYARFWFGLSGGAGFAFRGSADNVCLLTPTGQVANSAFYCTTPYGSDFPSRASAAENSTLSPGTAGHVSGGLSPAAIRVMFTFDFAATRNLLLGIRVGVVFGTYTGDAAKTAGAILPIPLHLEARGTWIFGDKPLSHEGFAPLVMVAAGTTRIDTNATVVVSQKGIAGQRPEVAWQLGGPLFVGAGVGVRYAFSQRTAFMTIARLDAALLGGGFLPALGLEATVQYGF